MGKLEKINELAMEIVNDEEGSYQLASYRLADMNAQRIALLSQPETTAKKVNGMIKELQDIAVKSSNSQSRRDLIGYHKLQHQLMVAMEALNVVESIACGKEFV